MKKNFPVSGVEYDYPKETHIVSTTNLKGIVSSANADFIRISGFTEEEIIGKNHNLVRHPDMPPAAFADLWATCKEGKPWMGIVKNRCKNGDHYWVDAYVNPSFEDGEVVGYQSVRCKPDRKDVERAERLYQKLNKGVNFWQRLSSKLQTGIMGKIFFGQLLILLPILGVMFSFASIEVVAIASIASLVSAWFVAKFIARPWQEAAKDSREFFDNAVAQQVYTGRADELGQLQLVIKAQQARLGTVVWRIDSAAGSLDKIADGTAVVVEQTNQAIHEQQVEIEQVATAMNEMTATVHEVAKTTTDAAKAASSADSSAKEGTQAAVESMCGIDKLVGDVQQAADIIHQLEQETNSIGSVLDVIRGVAEQTNLLALNAAIEAARAGEAGRGFAVVADEVRTLASRTQESTKEIDKMVERLQSGANEAVQAMGLAQSSAESNSEQAETLVESLASITGAVRTINDMNTQIASAAEEQSTVSEEINLNISNISSVGEQTAAASEETANANRNLIQQAGQLRVVVRQFGLG